MKTRWLCAGLLVCAIAVATAGEHDAEEMEELRDQLRAEIEEEMWAEREERPEILERNVKLEFKAVPLEEDDKGLFIITGLSVYETGVQLHGKEGVVGFHVSGNVDLLDDGRIFVGYNTHAEFGNKEGEAEFGAAGGVLLKPGQEIGVARLGDKTLMIRASLVDGEDED